MSSWIRTSAPQVLAATRALRSAPGAYAGVGVYLIKAKIYLNSFYLSAGRLAGAFARCRALRYPAAMNSEPQPRASLGHSEWDASASVHPRQWARSALRELFPPPCNRKALVALFQMRAPWRTARSWRNGERTPPAWALVIIERELERRFQLRAAQYQEAIRMLKSVVPYDPAEHMRAMWRRKRARAAEAAWERGKKERGAI